MHAVNFRRWHKWLFLVIGAQMLMWMIGGFYMVAVPLTIIHGDHLVKESDSSAFVPPNAADLNRILSKTDRVLRIKPAPQMGETVLEIQFPERKALYDLAQDEFIDPPNEKDIFRIAKEKHATAASPAKIDLLTEPLTELQGRPMPLWRAEFAGSFRPTLYFSPETGELISRRHDLWRIFDFVWMLHIMDYEERANVNNVLLRSVAGINLMAVITGLFLVYYTLGKDRRSKKQFKSGFVASVHKWLGLIIGAQVLVWVASGFGMSLIPHDAIDERHMVAERAPRYLSADDIGAVDTEIAARRDAGLWELRNVNGAPAFILGAGEAVEVIDARTGALISVEKATAERIAKVLYNGEGDLKTLDYLSKPGVENRTFYGPAWRADFSDKSGTTFYISALTGELQAARSNLWRVFDTLWMFHMMDYVRANSFNAPWIVLAGLLSVFIGLSGLILLMKSFTLADFLPFFLRPSHTVSISQSECGTATFRLAARRGETLFSVLHKNQVALDSSCGGGGTCGQCVVEIAGAGPQKDVSKADNRHLTREEICDGKRLACQKRVDHDLSVIVHGPGAFVEATVLSNREISSGMHEIVLRFPEPERHVAGQYRYFKAPPYKLDKSEYRAATGSDQARPFVSRRQEIRSYSMSTPSGDGESVASFIIRKMPPMKRNAPPGVGATYVCSRRPGDVLQVSKPRGAFRVRDDHDRIVMIGGGAGMAPLRAMILDLLIVRNDARSFAFYYGARTEADLIYREELEDLAARHGNFTFECAVSDGRGSRDKWPVCHIHELAERRLNVAGAKEEFGGTGFYLCGPPAMLTAATKMLRKLGAAPEQISIDDFGI